MLASKSTPYFLCLLLLAVVSGCSIALKPEARNIQIVESEMANCRYLADVSGSLSNGASTIDDREGAQNEMLNKASSLGATHVKILNQSSNVFRSTVTGSAYNCSSQQVSSDNSPKATQIPDPCVGDGAKECEALRAKCDKKVGSACYELALKRDSAEDYNAAGDLIRTSCELKYKPACKIKSSMDSIKFFDAEREKCLEGDGKACINIEKSCSKKNAEACLEVGFFADKKGNEVDSEKYARMSCEYGSKRGCTIYGAFQTFKVQAEKQKANDQIRMKQAANKRSQQEENLRTRQLQQIEEQRQQQALQDGMQSFIQMSQPSVNQEQKTTYCESRPIYGVKGEVLRVDTDCR